MCLPHGPDYGGAGGRSTAVASDRIEPLDPLHALAHIRENKAYMALLCKCNPELVTAADINRLDRALTKELERFMGQRLRSLNTAKGQYHPPAERAVERNKNRLFEEMAAIIRCAYAEYIEDKVCLHCRGKGKVLAYHEAQGLVPEACPECVGLGWKAWSNKRRAEEMGKDREGKRFLTLLLPAQEHLLAIMRDRYLSLQGQFEQALRGEGVVVKRGEREPQYRKAG